MTEQWTVCLFKARPRFLKLGLYRENFTNKYTWNSETGYIQRQDYFLSWVFWFRYQISHHIYRICCQARVFQCHLEGYQRKLENVVNRRGSYFQQIFWIVHFFNIIVVWERLYDYNYTVFKLKKFLNSIRPRHFWSMQNYTQPYLEIGTCYNLWKYWKKIYE